MRTIRSSREIDQVFRTARRVAGPLAIALVAPSKPGRDHNGRVAFVAGKRLGNAVKRNRGKRLLREAARACNGPWEGFDVVIMAKAATLGASGPEVTQALRSLLSRAGVVS